MRLLEVKLISAALDILPQSFAKHFLYQGNPCWPSKDSVLFIDVIEVEGAVCEGERRDQEPDADSLRQRQATEGGWSRRRECALCSLDTHRASAAEVSASGSRSEWRVCGYLRAAAVGRVKRT